MTIPAPAPAGSHRAHIQARMRELQFKMLDVADGILDSLQAKREAAPALPLVVARRQTVNLLGVPALCERGRCRRTKLCHGEPAHCLTVCLHVLPHELLARVLSVKAMRQRVRNR
jgi:hypothetical protein